MEIKEIEFSKLRHAYLTVKSFLEFETSEKINSLDSKIVDDLGLYGDDNFYLLEKFVTKFELDYKNFEYDKHFYSEIELFGSYAALINLINLSVWLPLKTVELLTLNKIQLAKPQFYKPDKEVSDLTFKELLIWYIEKEYNPNNGFKYKIKVNKEK